MRPAAVALLLLAATAAATALRAAPSRQGACPLRAGGSLAERHAKECPSLVHKYMEAHTADLEAEQDVSKLVFFLHVPRTGGPRRVPGRCAQWQSCRLSVGRTLI